MRSKNWSGTADLDPSTKQIENANAKIQDNASEWLWIRILDSGSLNCMRNSDSHRICGYTTDSLSLILEP
jgi:hypothetical protein